MVTYADLSLAGATSEFHEYEPDDPIDGTAADGHFELRHANNAWGYEVIDLRHDHVYTKGIFDLIFGFGGGTPVATVAMLCNPFAHLYNPATIPFSGPEDPTVLINGAFNAGADLGGGWSGLNQDGVLWNDLGQAYYPSGMTPGHGIRIGSHGALRFIGKTGSATDRLYGFKISQKHQGQEYGVERLMFKNLTMMPAYNFTSTFSSPDTGNEKFGRLAAYNCKFRGNPALVGGEVAYEFGVKWHLRMQAAGCYDFRDCDFSHALEHIFYLNSVNSGLLNESSSILRCTMLQGTDRTFIQCLNRAEEQNAGPGRNTLLIEDCIVLGGGQEHAVDPETGIHGETPQGGANFTFAGFHGDVILRNNIDGPMDPPGVYVSHGHPLIGQTRSILFWGPPNKDEPETTEGSFYTSSGGNHGRIAIINHISYKPDCVDAAVWSIAGAQELHIFEPHIYHGGKIAIELDHVAGNEADPQYRFGPPLVKGWDPDLLTGTVFSNNPYHTPTFKRNPVNGPGMTAGAIGPGYEHIYTPGTSFSEWDGIVGTGPKLSRQNASSAYPILLWTTLDIDDYWSPMAGSMDSTSSMTVTLKKIAGLGSVTMASDSEMEVLLDVLDPDDTAADMVARMRGDSSMSVELGALADLDVEMESTSELFASLDVVVVEPPIEEEGVMHLTGKVQPFLEMKGKLEPLKRLRGKVHP